MKSSAIHGIAATFGVAAVLCAFFAASVNAAPPEKGVVLASSSVAYATVKIASQPEHFSATLTSMKTPDKALIDIEAYDPSGARVLRQVYDDVSFAAGESKTFTATLPFAYTQGRYHWSVGVFTPGWRKQIAWYDSAQAFDAVYAAPADPGISVYDAGLPAQPVPQGQAFSIEPRLVSTGADSSHLYIVVSLYDALSGQSGGMMTYYDQTLPADVPVSFPLTAASAVPAGNYAATVMVFPGYLGNVSQASHFNLGIVSVQ